MTTEISEGRSSLVLENLQEVIDASVSAKHATLAHQQQYETPEEFARFLAGLLPTKLATVTFDPQCASGNLLRSAGGYMTKLGFELDNRFFDRRDGIQRVTGNCVKAWEAMEDMFPELKFECQLANPPFGLRWKLPDGGTCDSTEYTWKKIVQHAMPNGFGFFIANYKTIERLGLDTHEWTYLYQKFPAGIWENCEVEVGVIHWHAWANRAVHQFLDYKTLDFSEHSEALQKVRNHYRNYQPDYKLSRAQAEIAFKTIQEVLDEERSKRCEFNIWQDASGKLKTYLSTRVKVKRRVNREEIVRLSRVNNCHPLALTTDRETRKLLAELVSCGLYTIDPKAKASIESALAEVEALACPIMPITAFEAVAYADEEDHLECIASGGMNFTPGKRYELTTSTYNFSEKFTRKKVHFNEETGETYTSDHHCSISGQDRYIQVRDDNGTHHRFMDKPQQKDTDHDESLLWLIFKKPDVRTIGTVAVDAVARNTKILRMLESLAGYEYYPGQIDYLSKVAVKDAALVAAGTGCGKSLMALSLIQIKGAKRALIIAPQGTMRSSDGEDESETEYNASQWVQEIRRFSPGLPVFELFSLSDYEQILKANGGHLPIGIFITYYQAFFSNGARETAPSSWNDVRLVSECSKLIGLTADQMSGLGLADENDDRYWSKSVGREEEGVRCIIQPCLATLIGDQFDLVAVDEAHICCNLSATVSQMLIRLQPRYRFALTATPIPNVIDNLFSLMGWLCVPDWYKGERRNAAWPYAREELPRFVETFRSEERDFTQEQMNRAANKDWSGKCVKPSPVISSPARLLKLIKPTMAHISKEACNPNVVPRKVVDVRVPMGQAQSRLYAHFLDRGNIRCSNPLIRARKQIAYLRNICADPAGFEHGGPGVDSNFNPKTVAILELVREILARGEQVVIVCARVGQTNTIYQKLVEAGVRVSRIDSTVSPDQHSQQANLFKAKKTDVHLMGIKCAMGYSFPECPNLIIGSLEYSCGSKNQAEGRVWRVNSKYPVTVYCILHKNSIEETIFEVVATKDDAATICLHGRRTPRDFKPVDMSEILAQSIASFEDSGIDERECESKWPKLRATFSLCQAAA